MINNIYNTSQYCSAHAQYIDNLNQHVFIPIFHSICTDGHPLNDKSMPHNLIIIVMTILYTSQLIHWIYSKFLLQKYRHQITSFALVAYINDLVLSTNYI